MDYYEILGISQKATDNEIKKAYRELSFKYHPDKTQNDPKSASKIYEINEAYETLSDSSKRRNYDMMRNHVNPLESLFSNLFNQPTPSTQTRQSTSANNNIPPHIMHMFEMMHGGGGGGAANIIFMDDFVHPGANIHFEMNSEPSPDISSMFSSPLEPVECKIELTMEESYHGAEVPVIIERNVTIGRQQKNETEKVYVNISPGVDSGEIITLKEKGHIKNKQKGDVRICVIIKLHPTLERRGLDLIHKLDLTFQQSLCGFNIVFQHIDGTMLRLSSNRIVQNNDEKFVIDKGFKRNGLTGKLIIVFRVGPPPFTTFNDEQIKTLNSWFQPSTNINVGDDGV